ncbi:two component transcriptional regulator [Enterobacter cloacae]|uniref:Two component transcriptional regulator n=1 Tax=Enterobacter cloacae TaxID=550 RepID=A0A377LZF2_ENTCL|nr:two component transcriptional regulator [Enterobacter cloacae]
MYKNNLILVAEDEDEIADILMSYLQRAGMKTLRATDGEQAINLTRLHKPDLVCWISSCRYLMAGAFLPRCAGRVRCLLLWSPPRSGC